MTRKIKRTPDYELTLVIKTGEFLSPPRDFQRNWLLNRFLKETGDDLEALDGHCRAFVPGGEPASLADRTHSALADDQIMEDWQIPVMRTMAQRVSAAGGDVLEIGFGRGVASTFIQDAGVRSHTVVECNDDVIGRLYEPWKAARPGRDIRLIRGKWQDTVDQLGQYDGVFFHTYPLNEEEFVAYVSQSSTFAEHFFPVAAAHLRPGGTFVYLTNEIDSLSRGHQRALLRHFSSFTLSQLKDLPIPDDTRDAQWARQTVIASATL